MKQLQFYKYAAGGLLLLNFMMLAFFFLTAPKAPPPTNGGRKAAIDIMHLDEQQHDAFLELADRHIELMERFDDQQRNLLKQYFGDVALSGRNADSDSLLNQVLQKERNKIESTYQHLQDVKTILHPDQGHYFEEFVSSALEIILMEKKIPDHRRKNK